MAIYEQATYLWVINGIVHGDVALQCDSHRHEDGSRHCNGQSRIEEVGEEIDVDQGGHVEAFPDRFQDGADEVARVHADQGDQ